MCRSFVKGTMAMSAQAVSRWNHHSTWYVVSIESRDMPENSPDMAPADGAPCLPRVGNGGHAKALEDEADDEHHQQATEDQQVVGAIVEPARPDQIAADDRHDDADDGRQTERVDDQREPQVEIALEHRQPEVGLQQDHERPEGQDQHAPEDEQMHQAGVKVGPEPALQEPVHEEGSRTGGPSPTKRACRRRRARTSRRRAHIP